MSKQTKSLRLDRLLVSRGLGNRRDMQKLIRRGYVLCDGSVINNPSMQVSIQAVLMVDGELSEALPELIVYYKPLHQLSTLRDPWGRSGLDYVLPKQWRESLHPVGRLDADTSGLLLFSSNGSLTQYLLHPKRLLPRRYRAVVTALPENLAKILNNGVETSLGVFTAILEKQEPYDKIQHRHLVTSDLEAQDAGGIVWVSVTEGKHRMVRRMLHNAGASVLALHRESYGSVELGDLKEGEYKLVGEEVLQELKVRP
ncbi:MAG: hypothetical protein CMH49_02605 [Myxococcales bacterium]|nr:hypothetical protein [Myxococcales bacterium]